jgi:lysophospholipase L1-like esterase
MTYNLVWECTRAQGVQLLVVLQPTKEQVYMPLLGETSPEPSATLQAVLAAQGIATLDLLPAFRRRAEVGEQLFFIDDTHPNRQGYQLIAQELVAHLTTSATTYGLSDLTVPTGHAPPKH